ncbi:hypothetical protein QCA50_012115 [Cerrena zonata]|uniref:Uncharacterized protein n=1 Tax=Cerrena zonata TaxID=2478898 RepID=A0AAW0FVE4_9APHY
MIGRDATDEMNAYHSAESIESFTNWKVGQIDYFWENLLPPIQGAVYTGADKAMASHTLLENKLDQGSASNSDVDLVSSASSTSSVDEENKPKVVENKGLGFPKGKVEANKTRIITKENMDEVFPVKDYPIIDPKELVQNYDNALTQQDVLGVPSLDYKTQQHLRDKYNELHAKCNFHWIGMASRLSWMHVLNGDGPLGKTIEGGWNKFNYVMEPVKVSLQDKSEPQWMSTVQNG